MASLTENEAPELVDDLSNSLSALDGTSAPLAELSAAQLGVRALKDIANMGISGSHWRIFKLSENYKRITWNSKGQEREIKIADIKHLKETGLKGTALTIVTNQRNYNINCSSKEDYNTLFVSISYLLSHKPPSKKHSKKGSFDLASGGNSGNSADVYTLGFGGFGQLGQGDTGDIQHPTIIKGILGTDVKQIACGFEHMLMLTDAGGLLGWGHNGSSRITSSTTSIAIIDEEYDNVAGGFFKGSLQRKISFIACGDYHSLAVADGVIYAWGSNVFGQLGIGKENITDRASPTRVNGVLGGVGTGVTADTSTIVTAAICCGGMFSSAVTDTGELYTWGSNTEGQLGHGDRKDRFSPAMVRSFSKTSPVLDLTAGDEFMAVVAGNETEGSSSDETSANRKNAVQKRDLYTWGNNVCGQLGQGDTASRMQPTLVRYIGPVSVFAAGSAHMCAVLTLDGEGPVLHTWGAGSYGQLGHGLLAEANIKSPRPLRDSVISDREVVAIACGAQHTVVQVGDALFAWGEGAWGQLGTGVAKIESEPRAVVFKDKDGNRIEKAVLVAACGGRFTAALVARRAGSTKGWIADTETATCLNKMCVGNRLGKPAVFNVFTRRHHCRNCGGVFCDACSDNRIKLEMLGYTKKVRVCDNCKVLFMDGKIW